MTGVDAAAGVSGGGEAMDLEVVVVAREGVDAEAEVGFSGLIDLARSIHHHHPNKINDCCDQIHTGYRKQ